MVHIPLVAGKGAGIVYLTNSHAKRTGLILPTFLDMELGLPDMDGLMLDDPTGARRFRDKAGGKKGLSAVIARRAAPRRSRQALERPKDWIAALPSGLAM